MPNPVFVALASPGFPGKAGEPGNEFGSGQAPDPGGAGSRAGRAAGALARRSPAHGHAPAVPGTHATQVVRRLEHGLRPPRRGGRRHACGRTPAPAARLGALRRGTGIDSVPLADGARGCLYRRGQRPPGMSKKGTSMLGHRRSPAFIEHGVKVTGVLDINIYFAIFIELIDICPRQISTVWHPVPTAIHPLQGEDHADPTR